MNAFRVVETLSQDVVYTLRILRKNFWFASTAVLTIALAIGGNTAMFSVIRAVLLKPLPYPDSDQLVRLGGATPTRFEEMKANAHLFTGIAAFTGQETPTLSGEGEPEVLKGVRISASFLRILGIGPLLGRGFREQEDTAGGAPVVMISDELWLRRFAKDPRVLGKTVMLSGSAYTIVGVLPPRFSFPSPALDVWMTAPTEWSLMPARSRALSPFLNLFGRLKPGVSLAEATAEAKVLQRQYATAHPTMLDAKPKKPAKVTSFKEGLIADVQRMLWMLGGAVGFVLLIACANVASLLLARATARSREIAIRSALGAERIRLIRQLLAESMVISVLGGILGVLIAWWTLRAIAGITAFQLPRAQEIHMDWTVLGFAAGVSILAGLLFGIVPALGASRADLNRVLRLAGANASQGEARAGIGGVSMRSLLLVLQVALSVVLLIGTALMIQSINRLRGLAIGFNPANVLTASVSLAPRQYDTNQKRARFFTNLTERLQSMTGATSASAAMTLPMTTYAGTPVQDAAKPLLKLNERPIATLGIVTPGYFRTLQIPLQRGRDFNERDKEGSQRVTIIDDALAKRFWPEYPRGQDPIGQHIWVGGINPKPAEVVGVVAHVHQELEDNGWADTVYVAFQQNPQPFGMMVALRTSTNPLGFASSLRQQVRALDQNQSISDVHTMEDLVDEQVGQRRLLVMLLGSFAGMALLLVLMGIHGVISYSVVQRTQEMGIRRALGAQHSEILRLVVGQSLILAVTGAAIGIAGAVGVTRLLENLLFQVSATDPATYLTVVLLFLAVAVLASYFPARRAAKIDPVQALRV